MKRFHITSKEAQLLNDYYIFGSFKQQLYIKSVISKPYASPKTIDFIVSFIRQVKKRLETQHTYVDIALHKYNNAIYKLSVTDDGSEYSSQSKSSKPKVTFIDSNGNKRRI
jgi:hypothetical protein